MQIFLRATHPTEDFERRDAQLELGERLGAEKLEFLTAETTEVAEEKKR